MDDFERRRLAEKQADASDRAATASAAAAAASARVAAEMEGLRRDAEYREQQRYDEEREKEAAQRQALFGTKEFCVSLIARAITLDPALRKRLQEHYARLLREVLETYNEQSGVESIERDARELNSIAKQEPIIFQAVEGWAAMFGTMPADLVAELRKCHANAEGLCERVRVFQDQKQKHEQSERRKKIITNWVIVVLILLALGTAIFLSHQAAPSPSTSMPPADTQVPVPAPVAPAPVNPGAPVVNPLPSRKKLRRLPGMSEHSGDGVTTPDSDR